MYLKKSRGGGYSLSHLRYVFIGFVSQLIDGAIGMAYGVSCRTLLNMGRSISSANLSAIVHWAEIPMTFISGIFHWRYQNIDKHLFLRLIMSGSVGGIIGTRILVGDFINVEPFVDGYLIFMGIAIFIKVMNLKYIPQSICISIFFIGFIGGVLDAVGCGGWGPVVTSSLLVRGYQTRKVVGTVNAAEFFVCIVEVITLGVMKIDFQEYFQIIIALILGGIFASPVAAKLCQVVSEKLLLVVVGLLLVVINIYNLLIWFLNL